MKRRTNHLASLRLLLCCLIGLSSLWVKGATAVTIGDLKYNLDGNKAYVTGIVSGVTSVVIPEKVSYNDQEYSVTSIQRDAFKGCSSLTELTISNSVTSIGNCAFNGCTGLKKLIIEDGESKLTLDCSSYYYEGEGKGLFYDCPLESIYIGRELSYYSDKAHGYSPFYSKKKLTSLTIGNSVTSISE